MNKLPEHLRHFVRIADTLPQVEVTLTGLGPHAKVMLKSFVAYRLKRLREVDAGDSRIAGFLEDLEECQKAYNRWCDDE